MKQKSLEERIAAAVREEIEIVPYDPEWPKLFEAEAAHLRALPVAPGIFRRIEHFGSTAVPGLAAKPVIDLLVEVSSLEETRQLVVPVLEAEGYEYFWRPEFGEGGEGVPWYAWFIKRGADGRRTHHIHMVEAGSRLWDRLYFRDYLRAHPGTAKRYAELKTQCAAGHPNDRVAYTEAKGKFIRQITLKAIKEMKKPDKGGRP